MYTNRYAKRILFFPIYIESIFEIMQYIEKYDDGSEEPNRMFKIVYQAQAHF